MPEHVLMSWRSERFGFGSDHGWQPKAAPWPDHRGAASDQSREWCVDPHLRMVNAQPATSGVKDNAGSRSSLPPYLERADSGIK
jgi:hypothetical protein